MPTKKSIIKERVNKRKYSNIDDEQDSTSDSNYSINDESLNIIVLDDLEDSDESDESSEIENEDDEIVLTSDEENPIIVTRSKRLVSNKKQKHSSKNKREESIKIRNERIDKKTKERNLRIFKKILKDKSPQNEYKKFKDMDACEQNKIIKQIKEINLIIRKEIPYRISLIQSDISSNLKAIALQKINNMRNMDSSTNEYFKLKNWIDTFMKIPFGKYVSFDISIENGFDTCQVFMEKSNKILNDCVYGLKDAKMQIMRMVGQLIINPLSFGTSIAIKGEMGTGKTTLIKDGVSKMLNRPFAFIALGGATDNSFLTGHSYTYEGSVYGKIVQILIESKCMNPVIYFDELDKVSDTPRGQEIMNTLIHLTDISQNTEFQDNYFNEVRLDISKCLFIFSYNDESKINPILLDRMYKINTDGYNINDKLVICREYLIPKIEKEMKFSGNDVIISDEIVKYINQEFTKEEKGVRNIKRSLETIYSNLNLHRLINYDSEIFDTKINITFPIILTKELVDKLLKKDKPLFSGLDMMYI